MTGDSILLPPGVERSDEELLKSPESPTQQQAEAATAEKMQAAAIMITFDPETQGVNVALNNKFVRNWNYAKGLLHQAIDAVDLQLKMLHMQVMQQAAIEQQQAAAMQAQLARRGR